MARRGGPWNVRSLARESARRPGHRLRARVPWHAVPSGLLEPDRDAARTVDGRAASGVAGGVRRRRRAGRRLRQAPRRPWPRRRSGESPRAVLGAQGHAGGRPRAPRSLCAPGPRGRRRRQPAPHRRVGHGGAGTASKGSARRGGDDPFVRRSDAGPPGLGLFARLGPLLGDVVRPRRERGRLGARRRAPDGVVGRRCGSDLGSRLRARGARGLVEAARRREPAVLLRRLRPHE